MSKPISRATTAPLAYDENDQPQRVADVIELTPRPRRRQDQAPPGERAAAPSRPPSEVDELAVTNPLMRSSDVMHAANLDPATAQFAPSAPMNLPPSSPPRRAPPVELDRAARSHISASSASSGSLPVATTDDGAAPRAAGAAEAIAEPLIGRATAKAIETAVESAVETAIGNAIQTALARAAHAPSAKPAVAPAPSSAGKRSRIELVARLLTVASGAVLAATVAIYGSQLWTKARRPPPPALPQATTVSAALLVERGRIELSADRRTLARLEDGTARWTAAAPRALESVQRTGPLILGRAAETVVAIDLESGRTRLTWELPASEEWGPASPAALGRCLVVVTQHAGKTSVRCLELSTGQVAWTQVLPRGQCDAPPASVPGAIVVPCAGWAAVLDERTGAPRLEAGAVGLVRDPSPYLLKLGRHVTLSPWSAAKRRFASHGELRFAATADSTSALLIGRRLLVRASDASEELVTLVSAGARPAVIASPAYRLADATPLVTDCQGPERDQGPPRFQLLELAPRLGASFDPSAAADRALALLDTETGELAWTSRKVRGLRRLGAPSPPICRAGHYFLPLELGAVADPAAPQPEALWIVDAQTGKTAAAVAFDRELGASLSALTADHVDGQRLVGVASGRAFELPWRSAAAQAPARGLHDARKELEAALGPLP